jgi:hypothetical protein
MAIKSFTSGASGTKQLICYKKRSPPCFVLGGSLPSVLVLEPG